MQQILPALYTFSGLMAGRVYAIQDADGLTLIDTGITSAGPKILKKLAAAGHQPTAVKRILLTHAHPDHVGGLPYLKEKTGAQVIASALEAEVIEGKKAIPRPDRFPRPPETRLKPTPVERVLSDGEIIPEVMSGIQALATPGHAPGHLAFWHPDKKLLLCGDTIFRIPANMRLPFAMLTVDMAENIRSIGRLVELQPAAICFGHGRPLLEDAAGALQRFARKVKAI